MSLADQIRARGTAANAVTSKRGLDIIAGTDYPADWSGFIGQRDAIAQLQTAIESSQYRGVRMDHTLLASGQHGIGKTTLAQICAIQRNVGFVPVSGPISVAEARQILRSMNDQDILFWDEFHLAVAGNRNRADWMLPFLTDGTLLTSRGPERMPDVTVIAATTEAGKLPVTIISRFMVRPRLSGYTDSEAVLLVEQLAKRMHVDLFGPDTTGMIARAADNNPREMRMIITALRDQAIAGEVSFDRALDWAGVTHDGLSRTSVDMLLVLYASQDYTASLETVSAALAEPGPLGDHERKLLRRGLIVITGRGRRLTDEGIERAREELA